MLLIDLVRIKAIEKVILQVTSACLRKVTNATVEIKFYRNSVKTLTYLKAVDTVRLLNLCKSMILDSYAPCIVADTLAVTCIPFM